jgi:hypothetical protein
MAQKTDTETEQQENEEQQEQNGENGGSNGGHKTAVRAAAIAAATGATAIAAKKAFSSKDDESSGESKEKRSGGSGADASVMAAMLSSGWHAAKDSLLPFAEDAAGAAGEWVGREGPDYLSDSIVPRFIKGFEKARSKSDDDGE